MTPTVIYGSLLIGAVAVIQSTVLRFTEIAGVAPDLVLIIVVFTANKNGTMTGQLVGFFGGLVLDMMGLAPLGFHALIYTLIGALVGITRGKMFVDPIFLPVVLALAGQVLKAVFALPIAGVFALSSVHTHVFSTRFLVETAYTGLLGPVVFAILGMIRQLQPDRRRGEII